MCYFPSKCVCIPAESFKDNGICCLATLEAHQDLLRCPLAYVIEVEACQILGAQPQEDGSVRSKVKLDSGSLCLAQASNGLVRQ